MMQPVVKLDGRTLTMEGTEYLVKGRLLDRRCYLLQRLDGEYCELDEASFKKQVSKGNVTDPNQKGIMPTQTQKADQLLKSRIVNYVHDCLEQGLKWKEVVQAIREASAEGQFVDRYIDTPPSIRSLQNWHKAWKVEGVQALISNTHLCGNRTRRCDGVFEEIVLDYIEEHYLQHDRLTVKDIAAKTRELYFERVSDPNPCGVGIVSSIIRTLPHIDLMSRKIGGNDARQRTLQAKRILEAVAPLDRVEIDATQVDAFVINEKGLIVGRPYVCIAVDAATGAIIAIVVELSRPTTATIAKLLKQCLSPRDDEFFERYDIIDRTQRYGKIKMLVADQGSENIGEQLVPLLKNATFSYWLNIPGHPEQKPFVERTIGTMNKWIQKLPGSSQTILMPAQTRTKKAEKEACLTLEDLETRLISWAFNVHAHQLQRRIQTRHKRIESPADQWKILSDKYFIPEGPTPSEMREIFLLPAGTRRLHRYGIEYQNCQYSSSGISELFAQFGPKKELELFFDPSDSREVAVVHPETRELIVAANKHFGDVAHTFEELKARRVVDPDARRRSEQAAVRGVDLATSPPAKTTPLKARRAEEIRNQREKELANNSKKPTPLSTLENPQSAQPPRLKIVRPATPSLVEVVS